MFVDEWLLGEKPPLWWESALVKQATKWETPSELNKRPKVKILVRT